MPRFQHTSAPAFTIWGVPHTATERLPGIWQVTTSSHVGLVLSDERQAAMPVALRCMSVFYEEDVEWTAIPFESLGATAIDRDMSTTKEALYGGLAA